MAVVKIPYQYKSYPYAPEATEKSHALSRIKVSGFYTVLAPMGLIGELLIFLYTILKQIIGNEDALMIISLLFLVLSIVLCVIGFKKLTKYYEKKIEKEAVSESIEMLTLTGEERQIRQDKAKGKHTWYYVLGIIIISAAIGFIYFIEIQLMV